MVKPHLLAEGAQQRNDSVLVSRAIKLRNEQQCVDIIEGVMQCGCQAFSIQVIKRTKH